MTINRKAGLYSSMPGLFHTDMTGGNLLGIIILEIWCAYFVPVCILSYFYFRKE